MEIWSRNKNSGRLAISCLNPKRKLVDVQYPKQPYASTSKKFSKESIVVNDSVSPAHI